MSQLIRFSSKLLTSTSRAEISKINVRNFAVDNNTNNQKPFSPRSPFESSTFQTGKEKAKEVVEEGKEKLKNAGDQIKNKIEKEQNINELKMKDTSSNIKDMASNLKDKTMETISNVRDKINVDDAKNKIQDTAQQVKDSLGNMAQKAKQSLENLTEKKTDENIKSSPNQKNMSENQNKDEQKPWH